MKKIINIPEGLNFESLCLERDPVTGDVLLKLEPIEKICAANNMEYNFFIKSPEDLISSLIIAWYRAHLKNGGQKNQVCESLIAEIEVEDKFGFAFAQRSGGLQ